MFKYYKKLFLMTLTIQMGQGGKERNSGGYASAGDSDNLSVGTENPNIFKGDSLSDLKELKKYLVDGKIDSEEAQEISSNIDKIDEEAKEGLKEVAESMLTKGFTAIDKKGYNAFKTIIKKSGKTLPSWESIEEAFDDAHAFSKDFNNSNFSGIKIEGSKIILKYDNLGSVDTHYLNYNNNGDVTYQGLPGYPVAGEHDKNENISYVNKSLLDDNISTLESTNIDGNNDILDNRITLLTEAVEDDDDLSIENGKIYVKCVCPDGKLHRGYFTIDNSGNSGINDSASLGIWKIQRIAALKKKYPKGEEKQTDDNVNNNVDQTSNESQTDVTSATSSNVDKIDTKENELGLNKEELEKLKGINVSSNHIEKLDNGSIRIDLDGSNNLEIELKQGKYFIHDEEGIIGHIIPDRNDLVDTIIGFDKLLKKIDEADNDYKTIDDDFDNDEFEDWYDIEVTEKTKKIQVYLNEFKSSSSKPSNLKEMNKVIAEIDKLLEDD